MLCQRGVLGALVGVLVNLGWGGGLVVKAAAVGLSGVPSLLEISFLDD
jgi:hypothetical protein